MPYIATRRLYNVVGKKVSRFLGYQKAKRMYSEISRDLVGLESRFLRSRMSHS